MVMGVGADIHFSSLSLYFFQRGVGRGWVQKPGHHDDGPHRHDEREEIGQDQPDESPQTHTTGGMKDTNERLIPRGDMTFVIESRAVFFVFAFASVGIGTSTHPSHGGPE